MLLSSLGPTLRLYIRLQAVVGMYVTILAPRLAWTQMPSVRQKPASATTPAVRLEQVLDADTRLNKKVDVDGTALPVAELLQQVSDAQVTLVAGRECQEWKLQAHLRQRSLKMLMQALAEMLPGIWRPLTDGHSYRLEMTGAAQRRRQRWWDLFEGERALALAAQREAALSWMRSSPDTHSSSTDVDTLAANAYAAREQTFFNLLAPELQQQVADNLNDAPYYSLDGIRFGSDDTEVTVSVPVASLSASAQAMIARRVAGALTGASGVHAEQGNAADARPYLNGASVYFANGGFSLVAGLRLSDGNVMEAAFGGGPAIVPQMASTLLNQSNLPQVVAKMGNRAPTAWRELAAFQTSRVWPNPLPAQPRISRGISRAAQLRYIAAQSGMEYLADYYTHGGHELPEDEQKQPLKQPLTAELNNLAAWRDLSWKQTSGGLYLFRNNRWYRDDRLEVPEPLLRRWYPTVLALRSSPKSQVQPPANPLKMQMDWEADIVSSLTRWQIMNGLSLFMPEEERLAALTRNTPERIDTSVTFGKPHTQMPSIWLPPLRSTAENIRHHYQTTLFYARLDAAQREAVLNGQLSFNSLSGEQQQKALSLVPALRVEVARADGKPIRLRLQALHAEALPYVAKGGWTPTRLVIVAAE